MSEMIHINMTRMSKKQAAFFLARERFVGYGGARGGGKSWAVRHKAAMMACAYPGIRILIIRRQLEDLRDNHINPMRDMLGKAAKWNEQQKRMSVNGSVIMFGYCDAERDVRRYQGQEYDVIFLDEATQLTESQFQIFKGCLRGVNSFPKRMYITCNPGDVGHAWVKRLFIDRDFRDGERPEDYVFIQAGVYDNKPLMEFDPGYVKMLESLPYERREAWLYGKWDLLAGQFFTMWDRNVHVVAPFQFPEHWRWYCTMDYGTDMLAAYMIAVDERGNAYVTNEVYEGRDLGEGHEGLIISEAAEAVKAMIGERDVYEFLAPPDMWNRRQESGRSLADIFAEQGLWLTRTSNDRLAGWAAMRERLKVAPDEAGLPSAGLRIFGTCPNLIRTLPLMRYDERRYGDAATEPHEITHASDAIRGFCVRWVTAAAPVQDAPRRDPIAEMLKRQKRGRR